MRSSVAELPWLVPAPQDFRQLCRELEESKTPSDVDIRQLSSYRLDLSQLTRLAKAITSVQGRLVRTGALTDLRVALLSDTTTDFLVSALVATAPRHGILLEVVSTDYDQVAQQVFGVDTLLKTSKVDAVLLSLDIRKLGLDRSLTELSTSNADDVHARLRAIVKGINESVGAPAIIQTLVPPADPWCGSFDRLAEGSARSLVERCNQVLVELARTNENLLFDVEQVAALVGYDRWLDPARWMAAKLPFSLDFVPLYADHAARLFAAMRGRSRKCLVLDLDNTLWGGVIGDDGLEGIRLGQGSADGEAFLAVQRYALECRERGIVLAACSKNEQEAALLPFRQHPEMLLKEEHFAVFRANWDDKASNLRHIAKLLNIGIDSLVFVDDNPAERERVRQMLPEVAVPELPEEPADYVRTVAAAGYFETIKLSDEDRQRAQFYQDNSARAAIMEKLGNLEDYLRSLEMVCTLRPFDSIGRTRITQLINKSNQYNLTTRRYTEAEVADAEKDAGRFTLQVHLTDKFGDNGMISVVVFNKGTTVWECDTWLMSCRVLGRRVEEAALAEVARAAKEAGAERLVGHYIPSPKNKMVLDHFGRLGFKRSVERDDGSTTWELVLADYEAPKFPMKIVSEIELVAA